MEKTASELYYEEKLASKKSYGEKAKEDNYKTKFGRDRVLPAVRDGAAAMVGQQIGNKVLGNKVTKSMIAKGKHPLVAMLAGTVPGSVAAGAAGLGVNQHFLNKRHKEVFGENSKPTGVDRLKSSMSAMGISTPEAVVLKKKRKELEKKAEFREQCRDEEKAKRARIKEKLKAERDSEKTASAAVSALEKVAESYGIELE